VRGRELNGVDTLTVGTPTRKTDMRYIAIECILGLPHCCQRMMIFRESLSKLTHGEPPARAYFAPHTIKLEALQGMPSIRKVLSEEVGKRSKLNVVQLPLSLSTTVH